MKACLTFLGLSGHPFTQSTQVSIAHMQVASLFLGQSSYGTNVTSQGIPAGNGLSIRISLKLMHKFRVIVNGFACRGVLRGGQDGGMVVLQFVFASNRRHGRDTNLALAQCPTKTLSEFSSDKIEYFDLIISVWWNDQPSPSQMFSV